MRRYQKDDLPALKWLWNSQGGESFIHNKTKNFHLLIENNPLSSTHDDYLVLEDEGAIIAYEGLMPCELSILGETCKGFVYHDTMVEQKRRGRGIGTVLVRSVMEKYPGFSLAVWMNEPNSRVFEKCGWKSVKGLYTYTRIYSVNGFVKTGSPRLNTIIAKIPNLFLSNAFKLDKFTRDLSCKELEIRSVDCFDDRVDKLFDLVRHEIPFIAFRTHDVLNWKFAHSSLPGLKRLICIQHEDVVGYMVYQIRDPENGRRIATITDFLCSTERIDVFRALLKEAILDIEKTKPDTLEILCSHPSFRRVVTRMGFLRARENIHALKFIHADQRTMTAGMNRGENWFFTFGDGDKVFWDSLQGMS